MLAADFHLTVKPAFGLQSLDMSSPISSASSLLLPTQGSWGYGATEIRTTIINDGAALRVNFTLPEGVRQYRATFLTLDTSLPPAVIVNTISVNASSYVHGCTLLWRCC